MKPIRVFLADDQSMIRDGIRYILSVQPDLEVVGDASDGQRAVEGVARLSPDVVLMDIRMSGTDGIEATRMILANHPETKVVVLTTFDAFNHVVDAIRAGAIGFLLKDAEAEDLVAGVRAAARGEAFFRTEHAMRAMQQAVRSDAGDTPFIDPTQLASSTSFPLEPLTDRELEVLQEMAFGKKNAEIAVHLHISEGTVKTHVNHILQKFGVEDRTQAVVLALRRKMVQ